MSKVAFITGVTGQDGSFLAEQLLNKGYKVHGLVRRSSLEQKLRIEHLYKGAHANSNFKVHYGDMTDGSNLIKIISDIQPDEIYNLAAQSHVKVSFELPEYTGNADALGTLRLLESIRILKLQDKTRFYQASTSEMFGKVHEIPQNENTPFYPRSPYGAAKLYAYWITVNYREAYGIYACNGILFNHESERRGNSFVTRKITQSAVKISKGLMSTIYLGNLDAQRDWGYAPDYTDAMWRMMQLDSPQDIVISTGKTHSVKYFVDKSFERLGIPIKWEGSGVDEIGINTLNNEVVVKVDPYYFRPTEVDLLVGDSSKAEKELGWKATVQIDELIQIMVDHDLSLIDG